jgi:ferrous iron transport protein B
MANCHQTAPSSPSSADVLILAGNPNVGKSVLFNRLTGRYVHVSNYPGTTVEIARARANFSDKPVDVIDTPGINDLNPQTDEGRVTRRVIDENPAATVVQVADAKNLRRALYLTLQLAELGRPLVLALNMADELAESGGHIDTVRLGKILGIPVVTTVAIRGEGMPELIGALPGARPPSVRATAPAGTDAYACACARLDSVNEIMSAVYRLAPPSRPALRVRLGFWAMHPVKGLAFLAAAFFIVYWFVGLFGAGSLVDFIQTAVFRQRVNPAVMSAVDAALPFPHEHETKSIVYECSLPILPGAEINLGTIEKDAVSTSYTAPADMTGGQEVFRFFHDLLVGPYGVITMALTYALAIVLPIVTTFFILFSILEDSGYLPRLSIMVNKLFTLMGLNGKAVLPMILGLGCGTMATMTTRILDTRKDRIVTTFLLALLVPCSAQLGVLLAMISVVSLPAALVWAGLMIVLLLVTGRVTSRLVAGATSDFILELPPMRRPLMGNVFIKTFGRLAWYLKEVIPLFVLGTFILFLLDRVNALDVMARVASPVIEGWLGLPRETAWAFLVGFLRRDYGAVFLLQAATGPDAILSSHQVLVAMVTITLFMPCIASFMMIAREHGQKVAWTMAGFIFPFAIFVGGLVNWIGLWAGV